MLKSQSCLLGLGPLFVENNCIRMTNACAKYSTCRANMFEKARFTVRSSQTNEVRFGRKESW